MSKEINTPNIVVDDNYLMLVNRLTRRYAERGVSVYTDAEVIAQERSDARARAIAPDAYRISKTLGDNPEMYKSSDAVGNRYMTTDDYLVYFSKCHDTFDAVNYYNLHQGAEDKPEDSKPRVLVNRRRIEAARRSTAEEAESAARTSTRREERPVEAIRTSREDQVTERVARQIPDSATSGRGRRSILTTMTAVAASMMLVMGSIFVLLPANEADQPAARMADHEVMDISEAEGREILQNVE